MTGMARGSRVGSMFGPYRLKRLLGRGGMGEVYEAEHTVKGWTVALKLLSPKFAQEPTFRKRMQREARNAGRLREPHVVPIHDYGEIDGQLFVEMRLVEGTALDSLLRRYGPLSPPRAVAIVHQIASALDAAHAAEVVHRDVKPQNILITRNDFAYLVDFGIANAATDKRLTELGVQVGTPKYMAPERFSNTKVSYHADTYALACVLYECLTGVPPYRADSASALMFSHVMDPVPKPSQLRPRIPKAFDSVIARGMAKNPEDRHASVGDLALAAHQALSNPDQDQAATILRNSQESTLPDTEVNSPPTPNGPTRAPGKTSAESAGSGPPSQQTPPRPPNWATADATRPDGGPGGPPPAVTPQYFQGGGWGGQPPPLQQPSGPTWDQPPPPHKRNPWPILAAALVVVTILGGLGFGIYRLTRSHDDPDLPPKPGPTSVPTSPAASSTLSTSPPAADAQTRLRNLLPSGYPPGTCKPEPVNPNAVWRNALAIYTCGKNTNPKGPTRTLYALFPDTATLNDAFNKKTSTERIQSSCPQGKASPGKWWHTGNPDVIVGHFRCMLNGDDPEFEWTNEPELLIANAEGSAQGPTIGDLYDWWTNYG